MIQSDLLPPEGVDYLNQLQQEQESKANALARRQVADDFLAFCNGWFEKAYAWRQASFHAQWLQFQRNSDAIYDPAISSKKQAWQNKAFVPLTPSHREAIQSAMFKLMVGARPILEIKPRAAGDDEQALDIRDLIIRELEKSKFENAFNEILEDATTFGSGFCRVVWDEKVEDRKIRQPILEPLNVMDPMSLVRHMTGKAQVTGYNEVIQPQMIYRGVRIEHISIWDFFCDPKALEVKGNPCAYRFRLPYGEILDGVARGYYLPEAAEALEDEQPNEIEPIEKNTVNIERGISDQAPKRTENDRRFEIKELCARLPQKWVFPMLIKPLEVTDPEKLIPAKVRFHKKVICSVELNDDYEGEAPYLKLDYMPVTGRFYGRGIPEMLKDVQTVVNEIVNQRLDNGALVLNKGFAFIDKALVDSRDLTSKPGMAIRINQKALGPNGDVRQVFMPLELGDLNMKAGFSEVYEWERMAQERDSANRTTLGTAGQVHDDNRTLGGQELNKQEADSKFAYIGMLMEFDFFVNLFRTYWKLIYAHIQPEDVVNALGPERAQVFQLSDPETVDRDYKYSPEGIFEMESKGRLQAMEQAIFAQFQAYPWIKPEAFFDQQCKNAGLDPTSLRMTPDELTQALIAQHHFQQASAPIVPGADEQKTPGPAGGSNENSHIRVGVNTNG